MRCTTAKDPLLYRLITSRYPFFCPLAGLLGGPARSCQFPLLTMLLLGIDVGTSSLEVSGLDAQTRPARVSVRGPADTERPISAPQSGGAEQAPRQWWQDTCVAIRHAPARGRYTPSDISAIGMAYQMHGLGLVDQHNQGLPDAIGSVLPKAAFPVLLSGTNQ